MQFNLPQQFWGRCEHKRAEGAPAALTHFPSFALPVNITLADAANTY